MNDPKKETAYKMWLKGEKRKIIAEKVGVSENTVKSWISRYFKSAKKGARVQKKDAPKKSSKSKPKNKGGQPGNDNATGGPPGNQKAIKHGGYSTLLNEEVLSDEELEYINGDSEIDEELELIELIKMYRIREHRLLRAINMYREEDKMISSGMYREETKRSFKSEEEEEEYNEIIAQKIKEGERLPGNAYNIQVSTEPNHKRIERLEAELTKVQRAKKEAIASLASIRTERIGSKKNEVADDWIAAFGEDNA